MPQLWVVAFNLKSATMTPCVLWQGAIKSNGYGSVWKGGKWYHAHRLAWIEARGPIPDGLVIDHLCRNRACVNLEHMEIVTQRENLLRGTGMSARNAKKTHCPHGHEYNERRNRLGYRICGECHRQKERRRRAEAAKRRAACP